MGSNPFVVTADHGMGAQDPTRTVAHTNLSALGLPITQVGQMIDFSIHKSLVSFCLVPL